MQQGPFAGFSSIGTLQAISLALYLGFSEVVWRLMDEGEPGVGRNDHTGCWSPQTGKCPLGGVGDLHRLLPCELVSSTPLRWPIVPRPGCVQARDGEALDAQPVADPDDRAEMRAVAECMSVLNE